MKRIIPVVLIGSLIVILFDTLASFASINFQIHYGIFSIGSCLIDAGVGFFAAKRNGLAWAVLAAGIVGLVDSTLGWYISWIIGPGRPEVEINFLIILMTIVFVTIEASIFGLIGGFLGRLKNS